jgi:hypothetical protein
VAFPACGSWQPSHRWWPAGADCCSAAWQLPQATGGVIVWTTDTPWHDVQSVCPGFDATRAVSRPWQLRHIAFSSSPPKAWGTWHVSQAMPPRCALVSEAAIFAWQLVQVAAMATGSSVWGAWHVTHAAAVPWLTWTSRWHPTHASVALPGECGSWQFRQTAWAGTARSASVVLGPWQPMHALSLATKSWG